MIFTTRFCPFKSILPLLLSVFLFHSLTTQLYLEPFLALALSTCLNLANFLLSASSFIDFYVGYFVHEGKGFLWYAKGSDQAQSHGRLLFDVDNFIPIQFPGFSNSCRSLNSKHLSLFVFPLLKVHEHFFKAFNNLSGTSLNRGYIISRALSSAWKGKIVTLRTDLRTCL